MDLVVKHIKGGWYEYERPGIYPDFLLFESEKFKKEWKEILNSESQSGNLIFEGKIVFKYAYSNGICKVQEEHEGLYSTDWIIIRVNYMLVD